MMVEIEGADTMGPIPLPRQAEGLLGVAGESPLLIHSGGAGQLC